MIYSDRREYDRAVAQYRKAIELDASFYHAYDELRGVETVRGRPQAVDAVIQSMRAIFPSVDDTPARARLAALEGKPAEARGLVEHWIQECIRTQRPGKSCYAAQIYASIGEKDLAFHWLNTAYEERNPLLAYAKVMPYYDNLRPDQMCIRDRISGRRCSNFGAPRIRREVRAMRYFTTPRIGREVGSMRYIAAPRIGREVGAMRNLGRRHCRESVGSHPYHDGRAYGQANQPALRKHVHCTAPL